MYKGKYIFAKVLDENMVIFSPIPVKVWFCPSTIKHHPEQLNLTAVEYVSRTFHWLAKNILQQ